MLWYLFYYNSLPDMPNGCSLFSREIMHRDFFECNPTNTRHHLYPRFEEMSYDEHCHPPEVKRIVESNDREKFVVFYTRHTTLAGERKNKIVGYFKVGKTFNVPIAGFYASKAVLLPKQKCIEINYTGRGVPVSHGGSVIRRMVDRILIQLRTGTIDNIADEYKEETKRIVQLLATDQGRKHVVDACEECGLRSLCHWGKMTRHKKESKLESLYGKKQGCDSSACV